MKLAIYGRTFSEQSIPFVKQFFQLLDDYKSTYSVFAEFRNFMQAQKIALSSDSAFDGWEQLRNENVDMLLSLGGDGTLLDTVTLVRETRLPVLGINLGRLGFLASINKTELVSAMESLHAGQYSIDSRPMVRLESDPVLFGGINYGLNELTIHKQDSSPMIIIHTYLDGDFLNSYWADGLIISTPAGSTAYSLSCGGPIVFPGCNNFVVNPIAPHNLNVRPVIINDDHVLSFEVEGRTSQFLVSLDSRTELCNDRVALTLRKADFTLNLVRLNTENYLSTLRNKLMWGLDSRN